MVDMRRMSIKDAFAGNSPTLATVSSNLGHDCIWITIQSWILAINNYVGKECFTLYQAEELSNAIISVAYFVKMAELAVFFNWLKAGKFGQIYGQLDPIFITNALQQFIELRRYDLDKLEREKTREQIEKNSANNGNIVKAAISLGTYEKYRANFLKKQADEANDLNNK